MKFSILTPCFNAAPYIGKCIDSVAAQDIEGIEHIIYDGNSKDDTAKILEQNSRRLAFWKSEPDKGQSDALNKALDHATGEIVGWLNADEYYEPNIFKLVHRAFEQNPKAVVVYGNYNRVTETGKHIRTTHSWRFDYDVCSIQTPIIMNCAAFFRRDALIACGGFARDLRYIMDWDLYLRLMAGKNKNNWVRLRKTLANFTMHRQSKSVNEVTGFINEIKAIRLKLFPNMEWEQIDKFRRKQERRMKWHMFLDGALFEKTWFKIARQRHYGDYFPDPGKEIPLLTPLLNWLDPPQKSTAK